MQLYNRGGVGGNKKEVVGVIEIRDTDFAGFLFFSVEVSVCVCVCVCACVCMCVCV